MAPPLDAGFLGDLAVVFGLAAGVTLVFHRLRQPAVLGYIAAGVLVSPNTPPHWIVVQEANIVQIAEIGVVFLLFAIGLDWSIGSLRRVGVGPLVATPISMGMLVAGGWLLGVAFGMGPVPALLLGAVLSVSSTLVVEKLLVEQGRADTIEGRSVVAMSVVEDVFAVLLLSLIGSLLATGRLELGPAAATAGRLILFVAVTIAVGYVLVPRILDHVGRLHVSDVLVVTLVGIAFGLAVLATRLGFAAGFGAFLAGFLITGPERLEEVRGRIEPLRDTFGALFFVSIGLLVDPAVLLDRWPLVLAASGLVLVLRPLAAAGALAMSGRTPRSAMRSGLAMVPLGEMGLVIAGTAAAVAQAPELLSVAIGAVLLTTLVAPYVARQETRVLAGLSHVVPEATVRFLARWRRWLAELRERSYPDPAYQARLQGLVVRLTLEAVSVALAVALAAWSLGTGASLVDAGAWRAPIGLAGALVLGLPALVLLWRDLARLKRVLARGLTPERLRSPTGGAPASVTRAVRDLIAVVVLGAASILAVAGLAGVGPRPPAVVVVLGLALAGVLFAFDALVGIHRRFQRALTEMVLADISAEEARALEADLVERYPWRVTFEETEIPSGSPWQDRTLEQLDLRARTGATVVAVEGPDGTVVSPDAATVLHAGDRIVLAGEPAQIAHALRLGRGEAGIDEALDELGARTALITVPRGSPLEGATLAEARLPDAAGVQVLALVRDGVQTSKPDPHTPLATGDALLVVGTDIQIATARDHLHGAAGGPGDPPAGR